MRKDAEERRTRLIAIAAELFAEQGYGVPLETVAERAGVGRGTLYRNFADRNAMILAVIETRLAELERFARDNCSSADMIRGFIRCLGGVGAFHETALVGSREIHFEIVRQLRARVDDLLEFVLGCANAAGSVRPGLAPDDLRMINRMLVAATADPEIDRERALDKALDIIMTGLKKA
ncbi:helix-turn-helix domain-containing protein [Sphingobium sp.]|uniref:TetR/AcrR family transcriptional regulator n=1 Tax=Sphingobium sp. TaxID=1912891 RepID=UPI002BAF5790|nr:helix-turn-helix domain-containing protein [Sphingobium sp.]HUD94725.1 helix-turn-helix domain-containing protein [Sphingobium sp.]